MSLLWRRKSKTQAAFEDITALTRIGITKCYGLHPPISTDTGAENRVMAHRRLKTSRSTWIQQWVARELKKHVPGDSGSRMMTRLRWRLTDEIRKEYALRAPVNRMLYAPDPRFRRSGLRSKEELLSYLSTLDPPTDPVLLDLWDRLIEAYPDWHATTNRQLGAVLGVHPSVIASRQHALALIMRKHASRGQVDLLHYGLRLHIGAVRKTDIHRVEAAISVARKPRGREKAKVSHRCPGLTDGRQCTYTRVACPIHRQKPTI